MNDDKLVAAIVEIVLDLLRREKKLRILALFSGGMMGVEDAVYQLKQLQSDGHLIHIAMTPNAKSVLGQSGDPGIRNFLAECSVSDADLTGELFVQSDVIVVPVLTKNTAAKISAGISDNIVTYLIQKGLLTGKRIVAARDACTPDLPQYQGSAPKYQEILRGHIDTLAEYGVTFTNAKDLAACVVSGTVPPHLSEGRSPLDVKLLDAQTVRTTDETQIVLRPGTIVTPLARDTAQERGISIRFQGR